MSSSSPSRASSNRNGPRLPDCDMADIRSTRSLMTSSWEMASNDSRLACQLGSISGLKRPSRVRRYGLDGEPFQDFGQLLELGLVQEGDLELPGAYARGEAGDPLGGLSDTCRQRRIDP